MAQDILARYPKIHQDRFRLWVSDFAQGGVDSRDPQVLPRATREYYRNLQCCTISCCKLTLAVHSRPMTASLKIPHAVCLMQGKTALMLATVQGDLEVVTELLASGVDVNLVACVSSPLVLHTHVCHRYHDETLHQITISVAGLITFPEALFLCRAVQL